MTTDPNHVDCVDSDWPRGKLERPLPRTHNLIPKCKILKHKIIEIFLKSHPK